VLTACIEQRARQQFDATLNRLCVASSPEHALDASLHAQTLGCVLIALDSTFAAGLDEVGVKAGVYHTQATNLGFTAYLDDVIIARADTTLALMTPAAFQELARAAAAVHEARLEDEQLRESSWLVILGNLQAFAPAEPGALTPEQLMFLRKVTKKVKTEEPLVRLSNE
jgi:hypothetical protein